MVRQAVRDVRTAPPPPPAAPLADPTVAAPRRVVDDLAASTHQIGELMLEVAPAYLTDAEAADVLAPLCDEIGETVENGLAVRRYALTGDCRQVASGPAESQLHRLRNRRGTGGGKSADGASGPAFGFQGPSRCSLRPDPSAPLPGCRRRAG
ncbi:hypothetical protein [Streptomyces huasconensis]|uniref:hypothetical protein n=1 Tax=Streptomyces huasconensis TaxID=1854574 RepID=UPI0033EE3DCC